MLRRGISNEWNMSFFETVQDSDTFLEKFLKILKKPPLKFI